jgi:hypothetical protein
MLLHLAHERYDAAVTKIVPASADEKVSGNLLKRDTALPADGVSSIACGKFLDGLKACIVFKNMLMS